MIGFWSAFLIQAQTPRTDDKKGFSAPFCACKKKTQKGTWASSRLFFIKKNPKISAKDLPHINNFGEFLIFLEFPCKEADWSNHIIDQSNRFLTL